MLGLLRDMLKHHEKRGMAAFTDDELHQFQLLLEEHQERADLKGQRRRDPLTHQQILLLRETAAVALARRAGNGAGLPSPHEALLASYELRQIGHLVISETGIATAHFVNADVAALEGCVYAWVLRGECIRIGAATNTLRKRTIEAEKWLTARLTGNCGIRDEERLARETDEARRWQAALAGSQADLWGRKGTMVKTPLGK